MFLTRCIFSAIRHFCLVSKALLDRNDCQISLFSEGRGTGSECTVVLPLYERTLSLLEDAEEIFDSLENHIHHFDVDARETRGRSSLGADQFAYHRPAEPASDVSSRWSSRGSSRVSENNSRRSPWGASSDNSLSGMARGVLSRSYNSLLSLVDHDSTNASASTSVRARRGGRSNVSSQRRDRMQLQSNGEEEEDEDGQYVDIEEGDEREDRSEGEADLDLDSLIDDDNNQPCEDKKLERAVQALRTDIAAERVCVFAFNEVSGMLECVAPLEMKDFKTPNHTTIASSAFQSCSLVNVAWTQLYSLICFTNSSGDHMISSDMSNRSQITGDHKSVVCAPIVDSAGVSVCGDQKSVMCVPIVDGTGGWVTTRGACCAPR